MDPVFRYSRKVQIAAPWSDAQPLTLVLFQNQRGLALAAAAADQDSHLIPNRASVQNGGDLTAGLNGAAVQGQDPIAGAKAGLFRII